MGTLVKLFFLALLPLAITRDYCSVCRDHTMCIFAGKSSTCGERSEGGVSPSEAREIVNMHNAYRARVAKGQENRGRPGPQPPAANMQALVWDDKLAEVAQRWADQCIFQHDSCRNDPRFKVGQNIYWNSGFSEVNWTRAVDSWYNEVSLFNRRGTKSFFEDPSISHYTQMVWANTKLIGCGRTTYGRLYKLKDKQPREFILSASPTKINDTASDKLSSKRTNRQANLGFFGGASFDPAGAQSAITGASPGGSNGNRPNYPGTGNRPNYPSTGNRPNFPGTGNGPNFPGIGNGPNFPGSGFLPNWPGLGNLPFVGGLVNRPIYESTGNRPNRPNFGFYVDVGNNPNRPTYAGNEPNYWSQSNFGENYGYYSGTSGYYPIYPNQYPIHIPTAFAPVAPYHMGYDGSTGTPENLGIFDREQESALSTEQIQIKPPEGYLSTYNEWQQAQLNGAKSSIDTDQPASSYEWYDELSPTDYDVLGRDQILVCNYGPSANYPNQPVYIEGKACSRCGAGTTCEDGLCVAS